MVYLKVASRQVIEFTDCIAPERVMTIVGVWLDLCQVLCAADLQAVVWYYVVSCKQWNSPTESHLFWLATFLQQLLLKRRNKY